MKKKDYRKPGLGEEFGVWPDMVKPQNSMWRRRSPGLRTNHNAQTYLDQHGGGSCRKALDKQGQALALWR